MFAYANRVPITMRILIVVALSLLVMASTLLVGVQQTAQSALYKQATGESVHTTNVLRSLLYKQGTPAITHGQLRFGHVVANDDTGVVDQVTGATGIPVSLFQITRAGQAVLVSSSPHDAATGRRADGALLGGAAGAAFAHDMDFTGISTILGLPYASNYAIIRDTQGRKIGMVSAAVPLASLQQVSGGVVTSALTLALAVLAVTLVVLFVVLRRIGRAIAQVATAAQGLARGDLAQTVDVESGDEVGQMAAAVRATIAYQSRVAAAASAVAGGDFTQQAPLAGERDALGQAFNAMVSDLRTRTEALVAAETRARETASRLEHGVTGLVEELAPAAEGDLTVRPTISAAAGDVAVVADFTGVLIGSFAEMARLVRDVSTGVQANSEDLAARVRRLTQAVQERTVQVNETAAVAERIADSATDVLSSVEGVNRATRDAVASVEQGNMAVAQTLERMDTMRGTMIGATRQIKRLADSSLAMNGAVGLVLQFAGDLELLADNAQIEAARHSEAGGVFGAVAEQTGRLAEDAQKALGEIQSAVLTNRQETAEVGRQMEQMAAEVVASARAVEEARGAFMSITQTVRELDGFVERVDNAARAQARVAHTVSDAMGQIALFFEQTARDARLSEDDAATLNATIGELRASIAYLKLGPAGTLGRAA